MREKIITAGVRQLREFGYPQCNSENILTDDIYRAFFRSMVEGTRDEAPEGGPIRRACDTLLVELVDPPAATRPAAPKKGKR